jgi:hypothetical protein
MTPEAAAQAAPQQEKVMTDDEEKDFLTRGPTTGNPPSSRTASKDGGDP